MIRILVVDDSDVIRSAVRDLFDELAEVHELASAIGLSGMVRRLQPNVVLLDVNMPAIRGDEAIVMVRAVSPKSAIVLFSDDARAERLAKERGVAWVSKTAPQRLVSAVMRAASSKGKGGAHGR